MSVDTNEQAVVSNEQAAPKILDTLKWAKIIAKYNEADPFTNKSIRKQVWASTLDEARDLAVKATYDRKVSLVIVEQSFYTDVEGTFYLRTYLWNRKSQTFTLREQDCRFYTPGAPAAVREAISTENLAGSL